jgi:uncharacterized repeat protein (TIGR03806 family)
VFEGSHSFKPSLGLDGPNPHATSPIIELPHGEAGSVIGGFVYEGNSLPALAGHYVFGDYVTGLMWAFRWDGSEPKDFRRIANTRGRPLAFGRDRAGELFMGRLDGEIHQLVAAPPPPSSAVEPPRLLSATGLFASTHELSPAPGVLPYAINTPLWSDGAVARHFLAMPGEKSIRFSTDGTWLLADGSALVRTLEFPSATGPVRVETQLMHREHGEWSFMTYRWNEEQTDAELVDDAGETHDVPHLKRSWRFPGRAECTICHAGPANTTLGLSTAQLNREVDYSSLGGPVADQISALTDLGIFDRPKIPSPDHVSRSVDPYDSVSPLDDRARAYLNMNCAHCHRPHGVAGRANFHLMETLPLEQTGLINGQPMLPLLGTGARLVAPGEPERSELLHRVGLKEGGRMPPLGTTKVDEAGVQLLREWIINMVNPSEN